MNTKYFLLVSISCHTCIAFVDFVPFELHLCCTYFVRFELLSLVSGTCLVKYDKLVSSFLFTKATGCSDS